MKHLVYVIAVLAIFLSACSQSTPEERAAQVALTYYQYLMENRLSDFVDGKAVVDSLPADYRSQLLMAARQYIDDMNRKHGGLHAVAISPNVGYNDSTLQLTYAFLLLSFADSTQEEICVPMVECNGEWKIR